MLEPSECLVLGAENSGKTFLLRRISSIAQSTRPSTHPVDLDNDLFINYSTAPTIGQDVVVISPPNTPKSLKLREVGGSLSSGWCNYFEECTAVLHILLKYLTCEGIFLMLQAIR